MATNTYIDISKESNKYVISLDSLDLSFLPTYRPPLRDKTTLLWTANSGFADEKYYEFEIKSSYQSPVYNFTGRSDDAPKKGFMNTFCHICNITVPNTYISEHVRSLKHTSFQKIADIALERVKKHEKMVGEDKKNEIVYFCEHCALVTSLENQNDHENTEKHKKHAAIDAFVDTFATFYAIIGEDDKNICVQNANTEVSESYDFEIIPMKINPSEKRYDEVTPTKVNNENSTKSLNKDSLVIDNNESFTKENVSVVLSKIKDAEILIKVIENRMDNLKEMNNNVPDNDVSDERANIVSNLEQYIRLLMRQSLIKLSTINPNDQERVLVETTDGTELVISVQNFHGFKRTGNKFLQCKICKIFVSNIDDHKVSEKHVKFVAQPFDDKHCLRRLGDSLNHCVLCNEVIDNPAVHILFNEHIRKLEQALLPKKVTNTPQEPIIDNDLKIVPATNIVTVDTKITDSTNIVSNIRTNTDFLNEPKAVVCNTTNICRYFCDLCNKYMHINDVQNHENGIKHITNSKTVNNYLMKKEKGSMKCKVCDTNVAIYFWAIEDHISSVEHVINYFNMLAVNKIDKIDDNLFCKPCSTTLVKMTEICHIEKKSHQFKLASYNIKHIASLDKQKHKLKKDFCGNAKGDKDSRKFDDIQCDFNQNFHYNEEGKHNTFVEENSPNNKTSVHLGKTLANESNTKIDNVAESIHNEKPKSTKIQQNTDDTPLLSCDVKNKGILNDQDNEKVYNERAKQQMMDLLISKVNNSLEELLKYYSNPPKLHYHLQRIDTDDEVMCKVCADIISIENSDKHINSLKHMTSYRLFIAENKLKLRENRYICYACNVYVENDTELNHIYSEKHVKRMDALKNEQYVLITADDKKLIDKIDNDLKFLENRNENSSTAVEFGHFLPSKKKNKNQRTNINHHFVKLIDNDHKLFCVLCRILVLNTDDEMKTHVEDKYHKQTYKDVMTHNQIFEIDSGFVCGFCECTLSNEFEHLSDENHGENRKKYRKKNFCFKCNMSTIEIGVYEHITSLQHIRTINNEAPAHYYCNICDSQLTNNEMNIKRHTEGFQHKNNCSLFEEHKVFLKNKKCFCKICESHFSRESFEDHISSFNHIMLMSGD